VAKLISKPDFRSARCYTGYEGNLVQIYETFATTGFRLTPEHEGSVRERINAKACTLCAGAFRQVHESSYQSFEFRVTENVLECEQCGNWIGTFETSVSPEEWLLPFISDFCPHSQIPALTALLEEVRANPKRLFTMAPKQFELLVGSVLSAFFDCNVYHVGKSRDGGIDLIAIEADRPMMVQVKRRESPDAVEGVEVVRLLFASMFVHAARKGMLITTAQRFSEDANKWVHLPALRDNSYEIDLVGFDRLLHMIRGVRAQGGTPPWANAISFWRAESPYLKFIQAGSINDAIKLTLRNGASISLSEYLANRDDKYISVDGGCLLWVVQESGQRVFAFRDDERSQCWEIPADTFNEIGDIETDFSIDQMWNRGGIHLKTLSGNSFYNVLHEAPVGLVEEMIRRWAVNAAEDSVTWGF
jgi:hypothetical protein